MRGEREEGADLVGPDEPLGHGAAAPLAFLRERRGALLQARHHVRRHADGRRAAARRRRLRLQYTHTHVNTCEMLKSLAKLLPTQKFMISKLKSYSK